MLNFDFRSALFILVLLNASARFAWAGNTRYTGRLTVGGYLSQEKHVAMSDGSTRNDFATASSRLFLKVEEVGSQKLIVITDLRDKHDFFDKLDRERKLLTDNNTLQVRQASVAYPNKSGNIFSTGGRFPIAEAGNVFVDGATLGSHVNSLIDVSAFGGLNARLVDQSYTSFNPDSNIYGAYVDFKPGSMNDQYLYLTNAYAQEVTSNQIDRQFWFSNLFWQLSSASRFYYLMYVDFFPRTFLQTGAFNFFHTFSPLFDMDILATSVDAIEYRRSQGVRETLAASQYQEGRVQFKQKFSPDFSLTESYLYGKRITDAKTKEDTAVGLSFPRLISRFIDLHFYGGYRYNFDRYGPYAREGVGYYRNTWELSLDLEQANESLSDGSQENALTVELASGQFLSRSLFIAESLEWTKDQKVEILSAFVKLSYRFGNEEIPPLRDGAPRAGRL